MRNVTGPGDVKPGDIVEHNNHHHFSPTYTICEVVKATDARLSVRFPSGKIVTGAYTRTIDSGGFCGGRSKETVFRLLTEHDKWERRKPRTPTVNTDYRGDVSFDGQALRDPVTVAAIHAEIDALAAWLAAEPKDPSHAR